MSGHGGVVGDTRDEWLAAVIREGEEAAAFLAGLPAPDLAAVIAEGEAHTAALFEALGLDKH